MILRYNSFSDALLMNLDYESLKRGLKSDLVTLSYNYVLKLMYFLYNSEVPLTTKSYLAFKERLQREYDNQELYFTLNYLFKTTDSLSTLSFYSDDLPAL